MRRSAPPVEPVSGEAPGAATLARALAVLDRGGLLIYPTDTLYALGGRARDAAAAAAVRRAKGREQTKPLPLVAADLAQARSLAAAWPVVAERLAAAFWPGPLTLVLEAAADLPASVTADSGSVAVRVPALRLVTALCEGAGPLISTSANVSGGPAPATCADAIAQVGPAAALALDAGPGRPFPSTIVSLLEATPRLLREGAIAWQRVRQLGGAGGRW
jgi:L-threonylcarbamoyladenylate synthase